MGCFVLYMGFCIACRGAERVRSALSFILIYFASFHTVRRCLEVLMRQKSRPLRSLREHLRPLGGTAWLALAGHGGAKGERLHHGAHAVIGAPSTGAGRGERPSTTGAGRHRIDDLL